MLQSQPLIETRLILSGLGAADRGSLCEILAFLRDETAIRQIGDMITRNLETAKSWVVDSDQPAINHLKERLESTARAILVSELSTDAIRLIIWMLLRDTYGLPPAITYSKRGAGEVSTDLGSKMAQTYFKNADSAWLKLLPNFAREIIGQPRPFGSFSQMVEDHVLKQVKSLAEDDEAWTEAEREALFRELCDSDQAVEAGVESNAGRQALVKALGTSGSVASLAAAVEIAGFSAYILAAKASAVIPLVGGQTLVSLLAVVTNPVLVIPAVFGGAWWAKSSSDRQLRTAFASITGATLSLIGLQQADRGLSEMLRVFRSSKKHLTLITEHEADMAKLARQYDKHADLLHPYQHPVLQEPEISWLKQPIDAACKRVEGFEQLVSGVLSEKREPYVLTAVAVGDLIYHAACIDPHVINAVDFSRTQEIDGILDFAQFAEQLRDKTGLSLLGAETNLKGYVAEETVMHRLIDDGYVVSKPESASEPGYDLIVDGQAFQVKCLDDLGGIHDHFEKYPDIPVYANAELQPLLQDAAPDWAGKVYFLQGFSNEQVTETTQASLDAGEELLDMEMPIFVVTLAAARNLHGWWRGQIPANELVWTTGTDVAGRGACSVVGGFAGAAVGLLLLGPAGAVIGGPTGTILGAGSFGRMKRSVGKWVDTNAKNEFFEAADKLLSRCLDVLTEKEALLTARTTQLVNHPAADFARARLSDDIQFVMEQQARLKNELMQVREHDTTHDAVMAACLQSRVHPARLQSELIAFSNAREVLERGLSSQIGKTATAVGEQTAVAGRRVVQIGKRLWRRAFRS